MTMATLLRDPKARDAYLDIPPNMAPMELADQYQVAWIAGDKSACAGIEAHVRQLAQILFQRDDVRAALRIVEVTKGKGRTYGRGGSPDLKAIARQIEIDWANLHYRDLDDGRIEFHIGTMKIRCENRAGAVAMVVAKYRKGAPRRNWKRK